MGLWDVVIIAVLIWFFLERNRLIRTLEELNRRLRTVEDFMEAEQPSAAPEPARVAEPEEAWQSASAEPVQTPVPADVSGSVVPSPTGPVAGAEHSRAAFVLPKLSSELEVVIGTSWLNRIGILAIIAAAAYFLKYAFDNQWIGPSGRVALTTLFGIILLVAGERYARLRLQIFGQGLTGGGLAVLYFASYTAFEVYELIGFTPAFALMLIITAASVALALRHQSIVIASLGLLAGFATPLVLGDGGGPGGPGQPVTAWLYAYFLLLTVAAYIVARRTGWWRFGAIALAAGFLTPAIVGVAATPHAPAAFAYFLILSLGALAIGATMNVIQLAWAAVAGGIVVGYFGGAGQVLNTQPLAAYLYFGLLSVAAVVVAVRQDWWQLGLATIVAAAMLSVNIPERPTALHYAYLAVLAVAGFEGTRRMNWPWVDVVAAAAVALVATASTRLGRFDLPEIAASGGLFVLLSAALLLTGRRRTEERLVGVGAVTVLYAMQLFAGLGLDRRDALTIAALALAAYFVLLSQVALRRQLPALRVYFPLGLAITFLTIAIPLKLQASSIALAWSVEGAALAWAAFRIRNLWAARGSAVISAIAVARLLSVETGAIALSDRVVFSGPGLAFAVGIVSLLLGARYLRVRQTEGADAPETDIDALTPAGMVAAAVSLIIWWGAWEIIGYYEPARAGAMQATLSAWLALCGLALVVGGIWRHVPLARWTGIGLLGATILKVFVIDLAGLEVVFRILSLTILGVLLLLASLAYNKYRSRLDRADATTPEDR